MLELATSNLSLANGATVNERAGSDRNGEGTRANMIGCSACLTFELSGGFELAAQGRIDHRLSRPAQRRPLERWVRAC
jgi:hypothetical protein